MRGVNTLCHGVQLHLEFQLALWLQRSRPSELPTRAGPHQRSQIMLRSPKMRRPRRAAARRGQAIIACVGCAQHSPNQVRHHSINAHGHNVAALKPLDIRGWVGALGVGLGRMNRAPSGRWQSMRTPRQRKSSGGTAEQGQPHASSGTMPRHLPYLKRGRTRSFS